MRHKKTHMTLEDHLKTAEDLRIARKHLCKAFFRVQEHYPSSSELMKSFLRILPARLGTPWGKVKCYLDKDYFRVITDAEFKEYGFIYHNGDKPIKIKENI